MIHLKRTNARIAIVFIGLVLTLAVIGYFYTPYDPVDGDFMEKFQEPSLQHWFGTDNFGRDVLSRIMAGAGVSVAVSLGTVIFAMIAGTSIGVLAGYMGNWTDRIISVLLESLMAFPGLLLALGIMTVIGPSKGGVVLALGLAYTPSVARIARGTVYGLRQRDFVIASQAMGHSGLWTVFRHILPNCVAPLIIFSTSLFGSALLSESALSFLGLGVPPPAPTWGGMLADSRNSMDQAIWLALFPGAMISFSLLGINMLGDAVRDILDPRMQGVAK
ncbi:ABC transporter permease [Undibacterium sp.]|jgi:peptide/nickel transport system permease protein|uniref:ABC transporter permease n=1 Tax=Undibacterium sp. TaxID=1914977 RepID=UPI002B922C49|nr:ABC transporter permease [Undibacterium sp.]HTD05211.1 ABC transporter permease [Undibacterium sp.]